MDVKLDSKTHFFIILALFVNFFELKSNADETAQKLKTHFVKVS
jgi:hypothetical protein